VGKNWSREEREDWLLPIENTRYDGKQMAYYWNSLVYDVFWYRQDLLAEKGLSAPRTWDELAQAGKALTTDRVAGFLIGLSRDGEAINLTSWLIPAFWTVGADLLDDQQQVAFNNEQGAQAFQWLADMFHVHMAIPLSAVSATRDNMLDSFKAGTAAMTVLQSNVISSARKAKGTGENLVVTSSPGLDPAKTMPAFAGGKFLVMGKDTKEPEAAALLMEHILSPDAQLINARIASEPPSRKSVLNDPWFYTPEAADLKVVLEYMAAHPHAFRYHEKHNRLADIIAVETQQIISNRKPIHEALDSMAKQWQEALKG
jgi:multiple sugar transport system substrate-binding protein